MEIVILSIVRGKWEHAWSFQWTEVSVFKSTTSWFLSRYRACDSPWLLDFFVVCWNEKWDWDRRIDIGTKNIGQKILKKKKKKECLGDLFVRWIFFVEKRYWKYVYSWIFSMHPGKFCNRLLTEILTEVPISHSLTEFNQHFNR